MSVTDARGATRDHIVRPRAAARQLVVTWQHPERRGIQPVGVLSFDGARYDFHYIRNAQGVEGFRPLLGFPELSEQYSSDRLFPLFMQRAMDARRADYHRYVTRLGLGADADPWEQIARSEGRRHGDTVQLFPVPRRDGSSLTLTFLVHGVRWVGSRPLVLDGRPVVVTRQQVEEALARLRPSDELHLVDEPGNPQNTSALLVATVDGTPVGYLPDLLVDDIQALRRVSDIFVTCDVVNRADAPWHLRLLARLTAPDAGDVPFFTGERWQRLGERRDTPAQ